MKGARLKIVHKNNRNCVFMEDVKPSEEQRKQRAKRDKQNQPPAITHSTQKSSMIFQE